MRFIKDILIFEIETTGADPDKDAIIQLSAVLLNKDNLLEQGCFSEYVRVSLLDGTIQQHANLLGIDFAHLRASKKIYDVIKLFNEQYGKEPLIATHTLSNLFFLKNAYKKTGIPFLFDPHAIDLWTLGYMFTLQHGIKHMPSFETFLDFFGLTLQNKKNALEKVRLSAEIFRKIINGTHYYAS